MRQEAIGLGRLETDPASGYARDVMFPDAAVSDPSKLPLLAFRAEVGAALPNQNPADRRGAHRAGFPFLAIHTVPQLKAAAPSLRIHVVGNRRAAGRDGFQKHLADGAMQAGGAPAGEPRTQRAPVNARAGEGLIGI